MATRVATKGGGHIWLSGSSVWLGAMGRSRFPLPGAQGMEYGNRAGIGLVDLRYSGKLKMEY